MKKKTALVIYNPVAGSRTWKDVPKGVGGMLEKHAYTHEWVETHPLHKTKWTTPLRKKKFERIVVVRGDGTVNEVAAEMVKAHHINLSTKGAF